MGYVFFSIDVIIVFNVGFCSIEYMCNLEMFCILDWEKLMEIWCNELKDGVREVGGDLCSWLY